MKDLLFAVLALVSIAGAVFSYLRFQSTDSGTMLALTVVCIIATLGFGAMFMAGRVNRQEDIHITE